MERLTLTRTVGVWPLTLEIIPVGGDFCCIISGGEAPHVGSAVLALPRPSLTGSGAPSCTSSVLNVPGHKDEALCRLAAETLCRATGRTVTAAGGFHADALPLQSARDVVVAMEDMLAEATAELGKQQ
ncbi:MAG: hypothetical protein LUC19_03070 [Oscillospiraceae bacterium]|nr:hypothetical protein [Oscillospiraceae bacterium]